MQLIKSHKSVRSLGYGIDNNEYSKIAYERKEKLLLYEKLVKEGCSRETALEAIKTSRSAFYRWRKGYLTSGLAALENGSKRPDNLRRPQLHERYEKQVLRLRQQHRLLGKEKIAIMMRRCHNPPDISVSTVGRIIGRLIAANKIKPVRFHLYSRSSIQHRSFEGHSQRWKKGMRPTGPGSLVQFDHMTVKIHGMPTLKHFSAICPTTRLSVHAVYDEATSKNASDFLELVKNKLPFALQSIQVDGGSEFMDFFERNCKRSNIPLFVLPPKSPKLNGSVERLNGTLRYEFYHQYDGPVRLHDLRKDLEKFVHHYNYIRPHKGTHLLTPRAFYEVIKSRGPFSHMY